MITFEDSANPDESNMPDDQPITGDVWLRGLGKVPSLSLRSPEGNMEHCRCVYSTIQGVYPTLMTEILGIALIESTIRNAKLSTLGQENVSENLEIKEVHMAETFSLAVCKFINEHDQLITVICVLNRHPHSYSIHRTFTTTEYKANETLIELLS